MPIVLYGNGKIAEVVFNYIAQDREVVAFTVSAKLRSGETFCGLPIVDYENLSKHYPPCSHQLIIAVGYAEMNDLRQRRYAQGAEMGYGFANYIHPNAVVNQSCKIGAGNIILDGVSIQPNAVIGDNNFVWSNSVIAHGCVVGNNCWITSGVTIAGDSTIGSNSFLGVNCTIGHNLDVGAYTLVGAHSLVVRSTQAGSVALAPSAETHRLDSQRFVKFSKI